MTRFIQSITEIVDSFDVAVVDQWGVLHNGSVPYSHAADGLRMLQEHDKHTVILSNSGKRAAINLQRIADMGFPTDHVSHVVTSGETLRDDLLERRLRINGTTPRTIFPICGKPGDAVKWLGETAEIQISHTCDERVDCIMLMGLPDGSAPDLHDENIRSGGQPEDSANLLEPRQDIAAS